MGRADVDASSAQMGGHGRCPFMLTIIGQLRCDRSVVRRNIYLVCQDGFSREYPIGIGGMHMMHIENCWFSGDAGALFAVAQSSARAFGAGDRREGEIRPCVRRFAVFNGCFELGLFKALRSTYLERVARVCPALTGGSLCLPAL